MNTARALLLALALEASEGDRRLATFRKRKSSYFATLFLAPQDYELFGLLETGQGFELMWRPTGVPRLAAH